MNLSRSLATATLGAVLLGGAALGATTQVASATPSASATSATSATTGSSEGPRIPCGAVLSRLPQALQDDLAALRALPKDQRLAAALEIREGIRDGTYGVRVQRAAKRHDAVRDAIHAKLPAALQQDLAAAKALPAADRPAAYADIVSAALAGDYGSRVQSFAERVQQRRALCG